MTYKEEIDAIDDISFEKIRRVACDFVMTLSEKEKNEIFESLKRGTALLETDAQMKMYLYSYGNMHQAKIGEVLAKIKADDFRNRDIQIVDWGCGQGLATVCFLDYFKANGIDLDSIRKVVLVEPSEPVLERAKIHVDAYLKDDCKVFKVQKYLDDVLAEEIKSEQPLTIHLFSNILDIPNIDLVLLANKIKSGLTGTHYFFCMGPLNYGNTRIDDFWNYFSEATPIFENAHNRLEYDVVGNVIRSYNYTARNRVFRVDRDICELVVVDYYLPKQFHAAYQLDAVRKALHNEDDIEKLDGLYRNLSEFEVQTPFDIGASVYDDVHPIFAVLNNIVTRGLPTKASPMVENAFSKFGNEEIVDELGGINYELKGLRYADLFLAMHLCDSRWNITRDNYNCEILDSDLEKHFVNTAPMVIRQLMQPQRSLESITGNSAHHAQRVDFAFQFPYSTKDPNGNERYGCAVEIDGQKYHSSVSQVMSDEQRVNELVWSRWYCVRLKETEVGDSKNDFNNLGSEYVARVKEVLQKKFDEDWVRTLQLVLSPIAIARLEKTILEALMTGKLDINAKEWKVLVKEHDVPCAAMAFEDLKEMFEHLTQMSVQYADMRFPTVDLTIVSTKEFEKSPLHYGCHVFTEGYQSNQDYDMVVDCAMLRRTGLEEINFSEYQSKNKCYFIIRSAHYHRNERTIYTSDRIDYKPLAVANNQGRFDNIKDRVEQLGYFLQLLFRKKEFRPGQTPILNRALQNKSVIGLLPTGGGKSLTYQIAAMLQPGITLVVDPLRSLMKDQYDGLKKMGIDASTYINSAIEVPKNITDKRAISKYRMEERERRAKRMEKSELQIVFVSPERLSITDFRERLKNMNETGVYFSYGVIDEVHCVSEWGHDFRFSYLHLGRNLYQFVLPKQIDVENESQKRISLFGLTATASFDVLADVERELSGDGAFPLDSGTIIRDGDTNRVELQYKIEPVNVRFKKNDSGCVKLDKWAIYDSKKLKLVELLCEMPNYMTELLSQESIDTIINGYTTGPRAIDEVNASSLMVKIPKSFLVGKESYDYGGIVFCPHKDNDGVAVFVNAKNVMAKYPEVKIGTFVGSSNEDDQAEDKVDSEDMDKVSFENLSLFRDNRLPIMAATKAFGMGIDKPNVRFTVNMNYSDSLEGFVQEAGRAGRDRKMALAVIMASRYSIARVKPDSIYFSTEKDRWYDPEDLNEVSEKKDIPIDDFEICDESTDLVRLRCKQCGDGCYRFEKNCCSYSCSDRTCKKRNEERCSHACKFEKICKLATVPTEYRWRHYEHLKSLKQKFDFIANDNYEFLNADYETLMYFYNSNFKGELFEVDNMKHLWEECDVEVVVNETQQQKQFRKRVSGFREAIADANEGDMVVVHVSYMYRYADMAKAIYRMCCIGLIDDYTQDYNQKQFRVALMKKRDGEYYKAVERYLMRYYSEVRAKELAKEVVEYDGEGEVDKCLRWLTHFVYDKIAVKRKRAIDDMHAFCVRGMNDGQIDWKHTNEELKDELYFYFNSKYARSGYVTVGGADFSLTDDTDGGKRFSIDVLFKYMQVVETDWMVIHSEPGSAQIDNAKHLYGAVRLIKRTLMSEDDNPAIYLLNAFCLMFLGTNDNEMLERELEEMYVCGMNGFSKKMKDGAFWKDVYGRFNSNHFVANYFDSHGDGLKQMALLMIHGEKIKAIKEKYLR